MALLKVITLKHTKHNIIPSSFILAFSVLPSICSPIECRDSLKMRKIRVRWATRTTANEDPASFLTNMTIKNGKIAIRSIMLRTDLKKIHLSGEETNRRKYSSENHVMLKISITLIPMITWSRRTSSVVVFPW